MVFGKYPLFDNNDFAEWLRAFLLLHIYYSTFAKVISKPQNGDKGHLSGP